jgi:hypothetical protein
MQEETDEQREIANIALMLDEAITKRILDTMSEAFRQHNKFVTDVGARQVVHELATAVKNDATFRIAMTTLVNDAVKAAVALEVKRVLMQGIQDRTTGTTTTTTYSGSVSLSGAQATINALAAARTKNDR